MKRPGQRGCCVVGSLVASVLGLSCGAADTPEHVGHIASALNVCDETVPTEHHVDGIPAYEQCESAQSSSIYSLNGVDTNTTGGDGWVRTQRSGGYQCTELARRYLSFVWGVTWTPNGNAGTWCDTQPPADSGLVQTLTPVHGDVIVFAPGACGASATYGHVAVIDSVDAASARVTFVEQNPANRRTTNQSCATCYLHVAENDGGSASGGAGGTGGAGGEAGAGGSPLTGGASALGGAGPTGGTVWTGGTAPTGGVSPLGGAQAGGTAPLGGTPSTGAAGAASGGAPVTSGGSPSAGGATNPGGAPPASTGGTAVGGTMGAGLAPNAGASPSEPSALAGDEDAADCSCRAAGERGDGSPGRTLLFGAALAAIAVRRRRRPRI